MEILKSSFIINGRILVWTRPQFLLIGPALLALLLVIAALRMRSGRALFAWLLRLFPGAFLILALAIPELQKPYLPHASVILIDQSASLGADGQAGVRQLGEQLVARSPAARLVAFGARPAVRDTQGRLEDVDPNASDVGGAIDLARSLLGGGVVASQLQVQGPKLPGSAQISTQSPVSSTTANGRILLLSDGADTGGRAEDAARAAASSGIPVDVFPVQVQAPPDVRISRLDVPATLRQGEDFDVQIGLASSAAGAATVHLFQDGQSVSDQKVNLAPGDHALTIAGKTNNLGFTTLNAVVTPDGVEDSIPADNGAAAVSVVYPKPVVLMVEGKSGTGSVLRSALDGAGVLADVIAPAQLPTNLKDLTKYDAMILVDVPADSLSIDQETAVDTFVRSLGKGLLLMGGRNSFSLGGYTGTPLEAASPVKAEPPPRGERPPIALLLIIDHSGSMSESSRANGPSKMALANEAAILAVENMGPSDRIGVVGFDSVADFVVPFTSVGAGMTTRAIQDQIATLRPSGGTRILKALQLGLPALAQQPVGVRHAVLLTDGQDYTAQPNDYQALIDIARPFNITLSTIGIGEDADNKLLSQLADWGKGRFYATNDADNLPRLTVQESSRVRLDAMQLGQQRAELGSANPVMRGLAPADLPPLDGYIATTPRPEAEVVLRSPAGDPLLATWQHGLGRAVAWTGDAGAELAKAWPSWSSYGRFWANVVRYTLPDPASGPLQLRATVDGGEVTLAVDSLDEAGKPIDLARTVATLTLPDGTVRDITLRQTSPGHYEQRLSLNLQGAYRAHIRQDKPAQANTPAWSAEADSGFVVPYPAEYLPHPQASQLLLHVAELSGGRVLNQISQLEATVGEPPEPPQPLWPYLLGAALVAWPIEIAIRRRWLPW